MKELWAKRSGSSCISWRLDWALYNDGRGIGSYGNGLCFVLALQFLVFNAKLTSFSREFRRFLERFLQRRGTETRVLELFPFEWSLHSSECADDRSAGRRSDEKNEKIPRPLCTPIPLGLSRNKSALLLDCIFLSRRLLFLSFRVWPS